MDAAPRRIGRYLMYEPPLATGGMGAVHLGKLVETIGFSRVVAIKRTLAGAAQDASSALLDEARFGGRIRHPNAVATLDVLVEAGELFVVMDYVHGESLGRLLRACARAGERAPVAIGAAVVAGALHGLHAAHEAVDEIGAPLGLVHRDVTPQNVLVGTDGVARIVDFGIAKARGRTQETTREGIVKGKLGYMAPEQLRGATVDRRADVFAAGVVLWEMLVGRQLFVGENEGDTLTRALTLPIERPGALVAGIPEALDDVVMRALERDPARRFDTARQMAAALEQCVHLASASEVGEWVTMTAIELPLRAELVRALEASAPGASNAAGAARGEPRARAAPAPRRAVVAAAGALVALSIAGAALVAKRGASSAAELASPAADAGHALAESTDLAVATAPSAAPVAPVAPPTAAGAPASSPAPRASRQVRRAEPRTAGRPAAKPAACDPPYTTDAAGVRHYKPECPLE